MKSSESLGSRGWHAAAGEIIAVSQERKQRLPVCAALIPGLTLNWKIDEGTETRCSNAGTQNAGLGNWKHKGCHDVMK